MKTVMSFPGKRQAAMIKVKDT